MMTIAITQIINIKLVIQLTGLSRSTIYEMLKPKSKYYDPTFPKQVELTVGRVGWVAKEISDWIDSKVAAREQTEPPLAS
ncbi:helix-turn-helix transcriptional regulator [Alkanindiges illinoisensis]|uniref:AlpA family phage regulatory protein n=1 Tax=Alkanindiges illinoisensis TaxID=197183 RepID=A0A4Y7XDV7_9GAMM|nr:AlpA family phage regulatory protein [Alkanindiges illinoisensis]TEU28526.1 AlpA family phage regulatory protein [Alkanindiges illinoisensis]